MRVWLLLPVLVAGCQPIFGIEGGTLGEALGKPLEPCLQTSGAVFSDTFDLYLDSDWQTWSGGGLSPGYVGAADGFAYVFIGAPETNVAGATLNKQLRVRDCAVSVQVGDIPNPYEDTYGLVRLSNGLEGDDDRGVEITINPLLRLIFQSSSGGEVVQSQEITFDNLDEHRWWRFAERSGTLSLETSPDATSWTPYLSVESDEWLDASFFVFAAGGKATDEPLGMPGALTLDNLNVPR